MKTYGTAFVVVDTCFQLQPLSCLQVNEKLGPIGIEELEPTVVGFMMEPHKKLFQEVPG